MPTTTDCGAVRERLARLNDPEARWELGEDARRAELASLADAHLENLMDEVERLRRVLFPKAVA